MPRLSLSIGSCSWVITLLSMLLPDPAQAGIVIKQTVAVKLDKSAYTEEHLWSLDNGKFQLAMTKPVGTTRYIFNGRTFYVCGKLDEVQLKAAVSDTKFIDAYKNGACQVLPSNFMARFFLSPLAAVESVDASDGMRLTLNIKDYKLDRIKGASKMAGRACEHIKRSYTVTKSGDAGMPSGSAFATMATDALCVDSSLAWRSGLWKEVQKSVLRQPGGAALMKQLKGDLTSLNGMPLGGEMTQTMKDKSGHEAKGSYKLTTVSVSDETVPASRFKTPDGYKLFSPEGLELTKIASPANVTKPHTEATALDMVQSVIFCAIAGTLGCFAP